MPNLLESELDRLYKKLYSFEVRGRVSSFIRRPIAYLLKGITLFGALAIASGKLKDHDAYIGMACSASFTLDLLFSNLKRLLAEVAAGYAAKDQALHISTSFNGKLGGLQRREQLKEITSDEYNKAELALQEAILEELTKIVTTIQKQLHDSDIEGLKGLAIESKDRIK